MPKFVPNYYIQKVFFQNNLEASGEEGLTDMKIIEAIKQSADTRRKIKLNW